MSIDISKFITYPYVIWLCVTDRLDWYALIAILVLSFSITYRRK